MCLTKKFNSKKEAIEWKRNPQIAKKDIRCYKVLNWNNTAPYYHFIYNKGWEYSIKKMNVSNY